jgi:DNA mismatch repair ATPase MutS
MLLTNCCKAMEMELAAWKATIYDIVRKMDKMPGRIKEKFLPNLEDLHILVEELDQRIDNIRANCTPETGIDDLKSERDKFTYSLSELRVKAEDAMKIVSGGDFGG